jgi:hypothetical protein
MLMIHPSMGVMMAATIVCATVVQTTGVVIATAELHVTG